MRTADLPVPPLLRGCHTVVSDRSRAGKRCCRRMKTGGPASSFSRTQTRRTDGIDQSGARLEAASQCQLRTRNPRTCRKAASLNVTRINSLTWATAAIWPSANGGVALAPPASGFDGCDFRAADLFLENVPKLRNNQIGSIKSDRRIEKTCGCVGMDLRQEPLRCDTGVNDDLHHRRRSSAIRTALSECFRSLSFRRMRAARARLSMTSTAAARSTIRCSSA